MIRNELEALTLLMQPGAFAHPEKGGKSHYVKARKGTKYKRLGTVSDATMKTLSEREFVSWDKRCGVLNINITQAGRDWVMAELASGRVNLR